MHKTFVAEIDLKFFAQEQFEPLDGIRESKKISVLTRNLLRVLMMGWTESWTTLISSEVIQAVFVERNPKYLKEMRCAFQEGFKEIFTQLDGKNLTEAQQEQVQLYLSNCLSLLPYSDLTAYESIKIPQCIDGKWEMVEYQVKPIELTKGTERDCDRVFAYGIEPLFQRKAKSHLIFMGTTYPAGQGFLTQVNTDAKGFESVGKTLYRTGRAKIQSWLELQENEIDVCGTSLGGSLSLLLAIDKGNYKLGRVDALNPAGLHNAFRKSRFDHWDELTEKPHVVVQKQGNDLVSAFGIWKDDWQIYNVIPPKEKRGPNSFWDHVLNYAGLKGTTFINVDPKEDNAKRKARNFWIFSVLRGAAYYGLFVPYTYVIRPVIHFFAKHRPLLLLFPLIALSIGFAVTGVLTGIALAAVLSTLVLTTILVLVQSFQNKEPKPVYAKLHDPVLPRNKHMDIYNTKNAVEVDLTYKEINAYYRAMRCLVKQKEFLPTADSPFKPVKGMTKRALLETSEKLKDSNETVHFTITKAKAALIRHSLTLIHKIGIENKEKLKQALEENYREYRLGKKGKVSI